GLHLGVDLEFDVDAEEDVLSGEVGHRELSNEHRAMRGGGTISFGFRPGVLQRLIGFDAEGGWSPSASSKVRFEAQAHEWRDTAAPDPRWGSRFLDGSFNWEWGRLEVSEDGRGAWHGGDDGRQGVEARSASVAGRRNQAGAAR
ncbi:hypothetical protein ACJX0J_033074, partial [Zea mays]